MHCWISERNTQGSHRKDMANVHGKGNKDRRGVQEKSDTDLKIVRKYK